MKTLSLLAVSAVLLAIPGSAAPCAPGTLATYIALGSSGCTLGNLQVADFAYQAKAGGGAAQITADQIQVTPLLAPVGTFGLQFAAPWSVQSGQTEASNITYRVASPATATGVEQVRLDGNDLNAGMFASDAVTENIATPATTESLQVYLKCQEVCRSQTSAVLALPAMTPMLVVMDRVTLAAKQGPASMAGFTDWLVVCMPCV